LLFKQQNHITMLYVATVGFVYLKEKG
jgi:hypothetical protein